MTTPSTGTYADRPSPDLAMRAALRTALRALQRPEADAPLVALPDKGLAHLHLRLEGSGLLLRLPKQSQLGLGAVEHLSYEAACFERAAPSGHTPRLHAVLPPAAGLPRGALLVDEIVGRPAQLPQDLDAIADTLAAVHALPLPAQRAPLQAPDDALSALWREIDVQARHLAAAHLPPTLLNCLTSELTALRKLATRAAERPHACLISFDAHPGNYVVRGDGRAMLVDLEKARYGPAPLDLAHATLYTSTTWDPASHAVLDDAQLLAFHERWLAHLGAADAGTHRRWIVPLRRAMWLWSVTWCAKWRVQSVQAPAAAATGEDWSAALSAEALVAHVRERVDHYLSESVVEHVLSGFERLHGQLGAKH